MRKHYYVHLDEDDPVQVILPLRKLAEQIHAMNCGVHRFLSHLVDVRREALMSRIERYESRGDEDIANNVRREGDPLADEIERMLGEEKYL